MSTIEHIVAPEHVMAYLDGELSPDEERSVGAHLAACAACQSLAQGLRGVSNELRGWEVEAPADIPAPDVANHTAVAAAAPRASRLTRYAAAAVVVLSAGLIVWFNDFFVAHKRPVALSTAQTAAASADAATVAPDAKPSAALEVTLGRGAELPGRAAQGSQESQIVRTVTLTIIPRDFAAVRPATERLVRDANGFIGSIQVSGGPTDGRLRATLRVPADRLDGVVAALRALGRVGEESQSGEDVADQVRDLDIRLANSRNTETRLTDVLRSRTATTDSILKVEREIARVREDIERMEAERRNFQRRVAYATIILRVDQERHASLDIGPMPLSQRFRNAMIAGVRDALENALSFTLWLLQVAPTMLLWILVLWWPVRFGSRFIPAQFRPSPRHGSSSGRA